MTLKVITNLQDNIHISAGIAHSLPSPFINIIKTFTADGNVTFVAISNCLVYDRQYFSTDIADNRHNSFIHNSIKTIHFSNTQLLNKRSWLYTWRKISDKKHNGSLYMRCCNYIARVGRYAHNRWVWQHIITAFSETKYTVQE